MGKFEFASFHKRLGPIVWSHAVCDLNLALILKSVIYVRLFQRIEKLGATRGECERMGQNRYNYNRISYFLQICVSKPVSNGNTSEFFI